MTEAIDRMDSADSPFEARLLYFSTPIMSPRSSSILTEDGAELPSRSKKKKSGAVRFWHRHYGPASRRGGHGGACVQRVPACGEKDVHDVVQHLLLCIIVL